MNKTSARPADEIEMILNTYADTLFRLSLIMLGNSSDAEDVVQETMRNSFAGKGENHR